MLWRLYILVRKELQQILRTPQSRRLLIVPLLLQLLVFPFATTLDVANVPIAIDDQDGSAASIELVQRISAAPAFPDVLALHGEDALRAAIDMQQALLALRIPQGFARKLQAGGPVSLQVVIDGRRSNSAQVAYNYLARIVQDFAAGRDGLDMPAALVLRHAYNPNLDYKWFVLPSLVGIIATIGCLMVTGLSVAREREEGTYDQLMVTPLTPGYVMMGKAIPGMLIGLVQGGIIATAAWAFYGVPVTGSPWALFLAMGCYAFSLVGIGLLISAVCSTQQQAFLGVFAFMVPSVVLSGYIAPVDNMPKGLQLLAYANPMMHVIEASKGIFLKSHGVAQTLPSIGALLAIAGVTSLAAYAMYRWMAR